VRVPDDAWNRVARGETETERLDRNWNSLVQELRVVQTGVQFLVGALLIVPFQAGFAELSHRERAVYLATVAAAFGATVLLVAPVSWHRILFRRHRLANVVAAAHRCAIAGLALLGVALVGSLVLVVDIVVHPAAGSAAGALVAVSFLIAWLISPWRWRGPGRRAG